MKYVIKGVTEYCSKNPNWYVRTFQDRFVYTNSLSEATHFVSISTAIEHIVQRVIQLGRPIDRFTIVGVKEVHAPKYEEVLL